MSTKTDKAIKLMEILEIPHTPILNNLGAGKYHYTSSVKVGDLYDILMDEEKLKILISKLKNKAFW